MTNAITLSPHQTAQTVGLLQDAIIGIDRRIDLMLAMKTLNPDSEDPTHDPADLIEEREFASRLKDHLIAQLGNTTSPVWECPTEDCGWLNLVGENCCERCGETNA